MVASSFCVFDLDGTISDPAVGIARSLNYVPNRSVNTDAPPAALRVRRGSPVTFVRWAS